VVADALENLACWQAHGQELPQAFLHAAPGAMQMPIVCFKHKVLHLQIDLPGCG